jgi:hypothetical protein
MIILVVARKPAMKNNGVAKRGYLDPWKRNVMAAQKIYDGLISKSYSNQAVVNLLFLRQVFKKDQKVVHPDHTSE